MKRFVTACVVCSLFLTMVGMLGCKSDKPERRLSRCQASQRYVGNCSGEHGESRSCYSRCPNEHDPGA